MRVHSARIERCWRFAGVLTQRGATASRLKDAEQTTPKLGMHDLAIELSRAHRYSNSAERGGRRAWVSPTPPLPRTPTTPPHPVPPSPEQEQSAAASVAAAAARQHLRRAPPVALEAAVAVRGHADSTRLQASPERRDARKSHKKHRSGADGGASDTAATAALSDGAPVDTAPCEGEGEGTDDEIDDNVSATQTHVMQRPVGRRQGSGIGVTSLPSSPASAADSVVTAGAKRLRGASARYERRPGAAYKEDKEGADVAGGGKGYNGTEEVGGEDSGDATSSEESSSHRRGYSGAASATATSLRSRGRKAPAALDLAGRRKEEASDASARPAASAAAAGDISTVLRSATRGAATAAAVLAAPAAAALPAAAASSPSQQPPDMRPTDASSRGQIACAGTAFSVSQVSASRTHP